MDTRVYESPQGRKIGFAKRNPIGLTLEEYGGARGSTVGADTGEKLDGTGDR